MITPIYVEGKATCYPYPIKVNYDKNRVTPILDKEPSVVLTNNKPKKIKKVPQKTK